MHLKVENGRAFCHARKSDVTQQDNRIAIVDSKRRAAGKNGTGLTGLDVPPYEELVDP